MLFKRPDTAKLPLMMGDIYILMQYMFPGPNRLSIPICILIGSVQPFSHSLQQGVSVLYNVC